MELVKCRGEGHNGPVQKSFTDNLMFNPIWKGRYRELNLTAEGPFGLQVGRCIYVHIFIALHKPKMLSANHDQFSFL